ncbi:MAG: response regulator [Candidatus Peribacteraceae bacterium]|jgi:DNA-binding response OmpR family regulator
MNDVGAREESHRHILLLADTDSSQSELLRQFVNKRADIDIRLAHGTQQVKEMVDREPPVLLLLAVDWSKTEGPDALQYVRSKGHTFPVITLSYALSDQEQRHCHELGATACLDKNKLNLETLWGEMKKYIPSEDLHG